jgi:hypothetical protein
MIDDERDDQESVVRRENSQHAPCIEVAKRDAAGRSILLEKEPSDQEAAQDEECADTQVSRNLNEPEVIHHHNEHRYGSEPVQCGHVPLGQHPRERVGRLCRCHFTSTLGGPRSSRTALVRT